MDGEIQLFSDGDGLAVIGDPADVERFFLDQGLDRLLSRELDLRRTGPLLARGAAAARVGSEFAENSGRWVKLTAESARAVKRHGLMPTKTAGVSHAMIGPRPGHSKQWIQIVKGPGTLLTGPMALSVVSTMMQQQAIERQMEEIAEYLQEINQKVDDILRSQRDAVLADMIGVDLIIEEALTVRDQVGRVSEVTWSKVEATSMTIARTQAYAVRQLEAIAEKLEKKADTGEIAKATKEAEPRVREWLAVLARCFQLQEGLSVLELDRVLDASPEELDRHRLGLTTARANRLELISGCTARLLTRMDEIARGANSRVLLNPFDSPAAVRSSNSVAEHVLVFRGRLGIESDRQSVEAKRWGQAATEVRDKVVTTTAEGVDAAKRLGAATYEQTSQAFRAVDIDGDGIPDRPRALAAAEDAGAAIRETAAGAASAIGTGASSAGEAIGGLATGAAGAVSSLLGRKREVAASPSELGPETIEEQGDHVEANDGCVVEQEG